MDLHEQLKSLFLEVEGVDPDGGVAGQSDPAPGLHSQGSSTMTPDLSKNTVDEVSKGKQDSPKKTGEEGGRRRLEKPLTLGELPLEEFLLRAGIIRENVTTNMDAVGSSVTPQDLSEKTVDEVWKSFAHLQKKNGQEVIEEFLMKSGVMPGDWQATAAAAPILNPGSQWLQQYQQQPLGPQHPNMAASFMVAGAVQEMSQQERKQMGSTLSHMPLQQLKYITNNFSHELGRGGFGVVYKGMLGNGQMVAVKKLVQTMPSSQEQFENEVNLLMDLKHPNIVRLVGYCYEMQHSHMPHQGKFVFAWNVESLLCLEYLTNGSLDRYISDASSGLDWPTRCKIIEGISYGLQYLHEQSNDPIIHLDLKPANILLDENMVPKIADFGLSRLFDKKQTIYTALTSGTLGYMPPEYLRGIITPMSDIFSLGVIIMEVITGHREYPYEYYNRTSSENFIELELQKWRIVLQKEPGYTSLEADCEQIKRFLQIGLICVNPDRTKRPAMRKIIDMLQGLEKYELVH